MGLCERMKRFRNYFKRNWHWVLISLTLGQYAALLVIPLICSNINDKFVFKIHLSPAFFLIYVSAYLVLFLAYKPVGRFLVRYKNNFSLREMPFSYIDGFFLFLLSLVFSCLFFSKMAFSDLNFDVSTSVISLLVLFDIFLITWCYLLIRNKEVFSQSPHRPHSMTRLTEYYPDDPITDEIEDVLDRKEFVDDLYKQIINYPLSNSFVFGLLGGWGEGKTSVLNLLINKLYNNKDVIVFEFDPWHFSSQSALIEAFYEGLYRSLNRDFFLPNVRRDISKYKKMLTMGLKFTNINVDFTSLFGVEKQSLEKLQKRIEDVINLTGKKIIILMDDIDRLKGKDEIHQIFKLTKLTANFRNTIFILSFDDNVIFRIFEEERQTDKAFLEKIVQAQINLPAIDQRLIDKYLYYSDPKNNYYSGIDTLFKLVGIDAERVKEFENSFTYLYETKVKSLFPNLRCTKRYLNNLYRILPVVEKEVCLLDLLIVELIQVFYPRVYQDIWKNRLYYIPSWGLGNWVRSPTSWAVEKEEKYKRIKEHIMQVIEGESNRELLLELLKTIFFVEVKNALDSHGGMGHDRMASEYRAEKRLTHPDVFVKYFMLKVPVEDIPDDIVEGLIFKWNKLEPNSVALEFSTDINRFKKGGKLKPLLERLGTFLHKIGPSTAKCIISALYKNIDSFSKEGTEDFFQSEYDISIVLMIHLINEKVQEDEIEEVLAKVIQETTSIEHAVRIFNFSRRERGASLPNIFENINIHTLRKILINRLDQHFIEGQIDIFNEEPNSYIYIIHQWSALDPESKIKVNEYIFSLIDHNPNYLNRILSKYFREADNIIRYENLVEAYDVKMLYEKLKKYYKKIVSKESDKKIIDQFINIYEEKNPPTSQDIDQQTQ